ncbi:hypothetical protein [Nonomuraea insulae]|uniref:DUF4145 domain-containing protein n=1 Tax=Nonomuraea insulae TaxID=1616787 RepID=A0ABW1CSB1_9ACTN
MKLFEDTERKVEGQLDYFRDKIFPAHSDLFLGHAQPQLALFLETDLGLFSYGGKLITTTHSATFHLGVDPVTLLTDGSGVYLHSIYEEYGRYFGASEADTGAHIDTFVSCLDSENFNRWPDDVRADRYYRRVFNGEDTPDLNALLTVFRGMINFVDSVIGASDDTRGIEYTVFKIRYLTLYHVLRSLRILSDERPRDLTERSARSINKITQTPEVELILDPAVRPFRNILAHYSLDSRVEVAKIDVSEPLFGLIPIYFPSHNTATFNETVNRCIRATAIVMEEWAAA